jgi:alpha-amylase
MKYYFTNANITGTDTTRYVEKGDKVTFEKPEGWGDTLYAYVYDDSDGQEKPWPGTEMKKLGDGKYEHSFLYDWENPFIIFSDGENQYPGKNEQGLPAEKDSDFKME